MRLDSLWFYQPINFFLPWEIPEIHPWSSAPIIYWKGRSQQLPDSRLMPRMHPSWCTTHSYIHLWYGKTDTYNPHTRFRWYWWILWPHFPLLNTIATRRLGYPKAAALYHVKLLFQMHNYSRTAFGVSEEYLQNTPVINLGDVQGKVQGPITWNTHTEPLLVAYSQAVRGFKFIDISHSLQFHQHIIRYVDDNILILKIPIYKTTTNAFQEATQALDTQKYLIQVTGGDLSLTKCVCSFMGWKLVKGEYIFMTQVDYSATIEVQYQYNSLIPI